MSVTIPHSCQTYWWTTANFFQKIIYSVEGQYQPDYYHPAEDINQLIESFNILSVDEQISLIEILKNLALMANQLGDSWVNPHNRYNDPNLEIRIQNYNQLETSFYNLNSEFIEKDNYTVIVQIVTRILRRYDEHGTRFYTAFLYMFGIQ